MEPYSGDPLQAEAHFSKGHLLSISKGGTGQPVDRKSGPFMKVQGAGDHRVAALPFVDTHMHLWDLDHPDLYYSWLMPDGEDPQLGERLEKLKGTKYLVDDYIAETRSSNVIGAVHVQAALGIRDPVRETEWQQAAADRTGFPQAIVAYSNLKDARVE